MSFKPQRQASTGGGNDFKYPAPAEEGTQECRVSLIVDMGIQDRENFEELYVAEDPKHIEALAERNAEIVVPEYGEHKGKECISIPQAPKQGVAVFVDLVGDTVDYGGQIGEKHYRYMLNRSFKGDVSPITFAAVKPAVEGGCWTFHGGSVLTKLAKATKNNQIIEEGDANMDIEQLLGEPCLIDIDVKVTVKGDNTYTNVKHNSIAKLMSKQSPEDVPALMTDAKLIAFGDATAEDVKFIRKDVRNRIMSAHDFRGSAMAAAFVEAGFCDAAAAVAEQEPANEESKGPESEAPSAEDASAPAADSSAPEKFDDFDDDIPF